MPQTREREPEEARREQGPARPSPETPVPSATGEVLQMQQTVGNASVARMLAPPKIMVQRDDFIDIEVVEAPPKSKLTERGLVEDNINTVETLFENYLLALDNFGFVVDHAAASEAIPKSVGSIVLQEVAKEVFDKVISAGTTAVPLLGDAVKLGIKILEKVDEEEKKTEGNAVSNALKNLVVEERKQAGKAKGQVHTQRAEILQDADERLAKMDAGAKKAYRGQLEFENNNLTSMVGGSHSIEGMFKQITQKWIAKAPKGGVVHIFLDKDWKAFAVQIKAPMGARLAEQLMKDAGGEFDLNSFKVKRRVIYKPADLTFVEMDFDAAGTGSNITANIFGKNHLQAFVDNMSKKGLPKTKVMTGD